ncbi:M50 family metallopeptidase [Virgibacillus halodenitrificans]|uniref:M50 family metallopeptidase n=1 Tax=Virgibacillus halodenitrificans TaxID=1482 RepID=UPI000EF4EB61|nr:M50 family metallopeptidase [Virgibacillus halodenitrificans]
MEITFVIFVFLSILLTKLPVIGNYFSIVNTLIHETGHAVMAVVTGGKVAKIELFTNTEGTAWTSNRYWLGRVLTSLAGYVFSSFIGFLFLYFLSIEKYDYILYILITILLLGLLFWVRNLYGLFWITTFCAGFGYLLFNDNKTVIEDVLLFITAIILVQSVISAFEILYLSLKNSLDAGDATSLARLTFIIPAQLWGILFFLQSIYFAWKGTAAYLGL